MTYATVIKNHASGAIIYTSLEPRVPTGNFLVNPTLAAGDCKISIDGGNFANATNLPNAQVTKGVRLILTQAEINGDNIVIMFSDQAGDEWNDKMIVIQTALANFDTITGQLPTALVGGKMDSNVASITANAITAASIAAGAFTAAKFASGALDAVWSTAARTLTSLSAVVADIRSAVGLASPNLDTQFTTVTSATTGINTKLGTPAGASMSADIAAIKVDTAGISGVGTGSGLTAIPWNAAWDSHIASNAVAALVTYGGVTYTQLLANTLSSASYATAAGVASVKVDTGTTLPAAILAISSISTADVKAAMVEALNVDTYAEPGQGTPLATTTLADKIGYLFKAWRNKSTQDAATYRLYGDDGVTLHQKAVTSDNGSRFTREEISSGP